MLRSFRPRKGDTTGCLFPQLKLERFELGELDSKCTTFTTNAVGGGSLRMTSGGQAIVLRRQLRGGRIILGVGQGCISGFFLFRLHHEKMYISLL